MFLATYTNPHNVVVLVMDNSHSRYGRIARVDGMKSLNSNKYELVYADHSLETFPKIFSLIADFYRINNMQGNVFDLSGMGPESFKKIWMRMRKPARLERLAEEYYELFREELEIH